MMRNVFTLLIRSEAVISSTSTVRGTKYAFRLPFDRRLIRFNLSNCGKMLKRSLNRRTSPLPERPMKKFNGTLVACLIFALAPSFMTAEETKKPESLKERVSYSYGLMIARQLTERGIDLDLAQFSTAFETITAGGEPILSEDEVAAAFEENQKIVEKNQMENAEKAVEGESKKNLEAGKAFLAENAKKDGVKTTDSGLQYEVMKEGDGAKPKATDEVSVHYHGTLIDGTVFDSSVDRGEPTSFPLNRVIPGWTEGVQLMPVGAKYKFTIPYSLAYGERGAGSDIGPFSTLVFEVELLEIKGGE